MTIELIKYISWTFKFLLIIWMLLFLFGVIFSINRFLFISNATSTKAKIIRNFRRESSYVPVFSFVDNKGVLHTITSSKGYNQPIGKSGDLINILYDPTNPERAEEDNFSNLWSLPLFLILGGIFNILVYGGLYIYCKKKIGKQLPGTE